MSGNCEGGKGGIIKCGKGDPPDDDDTSDTKWLGIGIGLGLLIVGIIIYKRRSDAKHWY